VTESRLSLEGHYVHMARTGTRVLVGPRLGEGGQGVVHEAEFNGFACAVKWYRAVPRPQELRKSIAALAERSRPHPAFIWPIDLVTSDEFPGFGYVMPRVGPGFISFAQLLGRPEPPSFREMIRIGRQLVSAFEALHASGLCYRDISFGNLLVDPGRAEVAIIDNDNVGVDGGDVFVWGTLRFMAPEVVRRDAFPSSLSDLHSLAVFLFYLFVHGHPLEGRRTEATFSWATSGRETDVELAVRNFGTSPLFIFDPADDSNRPLPGDPVLTWWPIYPRFFQDVFLQAFTAGLHDATGAARVSEGVWRRALLRLADCVSACACQATVFYVPGGPQAACWNCGRTPPRPPLLELPGGTVVLSEGGVVTSHHLHRDHQHDTVVGTVEAHPRDPTQLVLRNVGKQPWTMTPEREPSQIVAPGRRLAVRPMTIDFGPARGRVTCS
jgi:DNA-binding helix-hairpin-helix protein with protein kinase domain